MDKFFLVSLLALLITAYGVAGSIMCDNIGMLEELKSLEALDIEEEENEVELSDIPSWRSERGGKVLVNIDSFGAAGDGESDDTEALQKAWGVACSTPKSVLLIPQGRRYLVNATRFKGPCADKLIIQIDGTLVAPDEPKNWDPKLPRVWLDFSKLNKTVFQGSGVIDGSGSKWWAASCKKNKSNGGSGYVRGVRFQNVRVENVSNPIIIDQFYCDSPTSCENQTTAVEISEVMYQNISGTTMSAKAIKFDCSDSVPCNKLVLSNVDLEKQDGSVETYCHSAQGFPYGVVHPSADCLSSSDKTSQIEESTTEEEDIPNRSIEETAHMSSQAFQLPRTISNLVSCFPKANLIIVVCVKMKFTRRLHSSRAHKHKKTAKKKTLSSINMQQISGREDGFPSHKIHLCCYKSKRKLDKTAGRFGLRLQFSHRVVIMKDMHKPWLKYNGSHPLTVALFGHMQ
ncbi:hypothetical protein JHK85_050947 [Glycine max]|nr:hypothetical protein JHK85_050947 [Glycine max]